MDANVELKMLLDLVWWGIGCDFVTEMMRCNAIHPAYTILPGGRSILERKGVSVFNHG